MSNTLVYLTVLQAHDKPPRRETSWSHPYGKALHFLSRCPSPCTFSRSLFLSLQLMLVYAATSLEVVIHQRNAIIDHDTQKVSGREFPGQGVIALAGRNYCDVVHRVLGSL